MGGGGKTKIDALARASGRASDRHTGASISVWGTRGQSPWRSAKRKQRRSGAQGQQSGSPTTAPSHGATPTGDVTASRAPARPLRKAQRRPSKRARARRSPGKERGESASGSAQKRRALRSAKRGKERVRQPSRSSSPLPIVTRMGRDYRPGPRQRIERVARRAAVKLLAIRSVGSPLAFRCNRRQPHVGVARWNALRQ